MVGEGANTLETILRKLVGDRLQSTCVIGARDAITSVCAAIESGLQVLGGESSVLLDSGSDLHQHRVSAPVTVEDLFSGETDLDRSTEGQGHLCSTDLVIEGIALATECTAVGAGNDSYSRGRQSQYLGQ